MTKTDQDLLAIHARACTAVALANKALTPDVDAFWPLYLQAALAATPVKPVADLYVWLAGSDDRRFIRAWTNDPVQAESLRGAIGLEPTRYYAAPLTREAATVPFQQRVQPWLMECFGPMIAGDREERNHRFFEEAAELVQACGMNASEAHQLVDYAFGRPVGERSQEVGGVMVTLAALCLANELDMHMLGEAELARISVPETVAKIRAKQAAKPKHSPLPEAAQPVADDTGARTYTTQPGESVMGIALRQCGNEKEWRHILASNPQFADMLPHEYFAVGTVLQLPVADTTGVVKGDAK